MKDHGPAPAHPAADPRFAEGRACFNAGQYFEAHEVWESLWHALANRAGTEGRPDRPADPAERDPPGGDRRFVQGLIQLAVSLEHWRRGNPRGARGQWEKAREKLAACGSPREGLDLERVLAEVEAFYVAADLPAAEAAQRAGRWAPRPGPEVVL